MQRIFGGATIPLKRKIADAENSESDLRGLSRHVLLDRIDIDHERGLIRLGARARLFHLIPGETDVIGVSAFIESYHHDDRGDLLYMFERQATSGLPFHYTARLDGPGGRFAHGFVSRAEDDADVFGEWSGVLVMSRSGLVAAAAAS